MGFREIKRLHLQVGRIEMQGFFTAKSGLRSNLVQVFIADVRHRLVWCKNIRNSILNRSHCCLWRLPVSIVDPC